MTIFDAEKILIKFFWEVDLFDSLEDFQNVISKESTTKEHDQAIFEGALFTLVQKGVIQTVIINSGEPEQRLAWVLVTPLKVTTTSKTITISPEIINSAVVAINQFAPVLTGKPGDIVSAEQFEENCVLGLVQIIDYLSGEYIRLTGAAQTDGKAS